MSEDPFDPEARAASRPAPVPLHIAGAGGAGMALLLVSLSVLFIASILAYLLIRAQMMSRMATPQWPPPSLPHPPATLWLSTMVILVSSVTMQLALWAVRRDNDAIQPALFHGPPDASDKKVVTFLYATFALGLLFLCLQSYNWYEFYKALEPGTPVEGPYLGMFYTLTGLHAAHVLGGLIPLAIITWKAAKGRYSRNFHPGIRYTAIYWHFLDVVWLALFAILVL